MRIIKTERFNVTDSATKEYQFNNNLTGDTVASEMYINLDADATVAVTGYVDEADAGTGLAAINMCTFEIVTTIAEKGNYLVMTGSLQKVKMDITGTTNVTTKILY